MVQMYRFLVLASLFWGVNMAQAQNVGVGTTSPKARLHVAGNVKTDSSLIVTPTAKAAAAAISISNNTGYVNITNTSGVQANAITMSGTAHAGQILVIMNNDDDNASFAGESIPAGNLVMFTYTGSAWKTLSVSTLATAISDADADTKIQVEESADEDIIRFDLGGTEKWVMTGSRLEPLNTGNSTFIGFEAGANDDLTNNENTAIGYWALRSNTTGSGNTAIGAYALGRSTTGSQNVATGDGALYYNTTGSQNVATGNNALRGNGTGSYNVVSGYYSMRSNTSGRDNAVFGHYAMRANETGSYNVALGSRAGHFASISAANNVLIGCRAGYSAGSNNVMIGYYAGYSETGSNKLYIDNSNTSSPLIYGDFSTDLLEINGDLRPGTDNAKTLGASSNRWTAVYATNGTIQTSDARFKTNVENMNYGLEELMALRSVTYQWKEDGVGETKLGFIAQELELIVPEVVTVANDSMQTRGVNYSELIPVLVRAIQEQQELIETQKSELEVSQAQNTVRDARLQSLETKLNALLNNETASK